MKKSIILSLVILFVGAQLHAQGARAAHAGLRAAPKVALTVAAVSLVVALGVVAVVVNNNNLGNNAH